MGPFQKIVRASASAFWIASIDAGPMSTPA
jgi:hypothetical protein